MRLAKARKLLKQHCHHYEKWNCGPAEIFLTGRDENPCFDRRLEIYLNFPPAIVDLKKITAFFDFLEKLSPISDS